MDQGNSEFPVNLLTLPTELLVFITSLLCSLRERIKLRYVSRWLACVIEGTPSLWKEFVWPYYDSREEYSLKEVLKACGQHIKVLSFPNFNRVPSTIIQMLKYCSNVQHLSLSSTVLDHEQLRKAIHYMGHLEILEIEVDSWNIEKLLVATSHLRELTMYNYVHCLIYYECKEVLLQWEKAEWKPLNINVFLPAAASWWGFVDDRIDTMTARFHIPSNTPIGATASFRVYNGYIPLNLSPSLPHYQLQVEDLLNSDK